MTARETNFNYGAYCGLYCGAWAILLASEPRPFHRVEKKDMFLN